MAKPDKPASDAEQGGADGAPFVPSAGLSTAEADVLRKQYGPNALPEKVKPKWKLLLEQFYQPMPCMIWIAIVIELALAIKYGEAWPDFGVLMGLQALNGTISFVEASKAGDAVAALKASLKPRAVCKRDGKWGNLDATLLVPGDLVALGAGAAVPADCRVNGGRIEVDQAALTGESLPVKMLAGGAPKLGSTVVRGEVEATVEATGSATFLGRTAALIQSVDEASRFAKVLFRIMVFLISISIILCCTVLGFLINIEKTTFAEAISFTVVLLVVSIPMAMEVVTTTTMAIGSHTLSRAGAIVARLSSIEELAGMNMLCSDKTGTLTLNKMAIQEEAPTFAPGVTQADLLVAAALATKWHEPPKDALDTLVLGAVDMAALGSYEALDYMPFDPAVKRTEGTVRDTRSGEVFKTTKGAPHIIAALLPADDPSRAPLHEAVEALATRGIRSLAVARSAPCAGPGGAWQLLGLLTFLDPPRPDTKVTLERAMAYGVDVKMVTGDHLAIAKETARQLGLGTDILDAGTLPSLDAKGKPPKDLEKYTDTIIGADGFAQVFPEHKFLIVEALRRAGFAVGMTGDGVNDAPALKRADIGIAVQGATDAARAAADIVLTSPGLSTIVDAITISRGIFRRMHNFVIYRVACTLQLLVFFFIAVVAFQPSDYALGLRSSPHRYETENVELGMFGPLGRPGGVVVMWHSDTCAQRTWDLGAIDAGLGPYSHGVSAAALAARATVPRTSAYFLTHNTGVVLDPAANTVSGHVCVEQWPRTFIIPLIALIFITLLNDGAIISIAYDNVKPAKHPEVWNLSLLYLISGTLGLVALGSSLLLLHLLLDSHNPNSAWRDWGLAPVSYGAVAAAMYLKVSLSDFLTLFSARTTRWFFAIRPSWHLLLAACVALGASTTLASRWPRRLNGTHLAGGFLVATRFPDESLYAYLRDHSGTRMVGVPNYLLAVVWIYTLIWWAILDIVKYGLYVVLERAGVLKHTPALGRKPGPCRQCEVEPGAVMGAREGITWEQRSGEAGGAEPGRASPRPRSPSPRPRSPSPPRE